MLECESRDELKTLAHESAAREFGEGVVPEIRRLEISAHDAVEVDHASDLPALPLADEEPVVARPLPALHVAGETFARLRRIGPWLVQRAARFRLADELIAIFHRRSTNADALAGCVEG